MSYDYVKRTYKVQPIVGERVYHKETKEYGTVTREDKGQSHYVMVRFDGQKHRLPCHPTALEYFGGLNHEHRLFSIHRPLAPDLGAIRQ